MGSKFSKRFGTDKSLEDNGAWVDFGDGIEIKGRRGNSEKALAVRRQAEKPYLSQIRAGNLPAGIELNILIRQLSEGVILDWKGVDDEDGKLIPYSPQACADYLRKYTDFRLQVLQAFTEMETFRHAELVEEGVGNS